MSRIFAVALGILFVLADISLRADRTPESQPSAMVHYTSKEGRLRLEGASSIRDFIVEGRDILGFVEVPLDFPGPRRNSPGASEDRAIAEVSVPVRSLRSVDSTGAPYSAKFDDIMHEKLGEGTQPAIHFRLQRLVWTSAETNSHHFKLTGQLAVGGRTNSVESPVTVTMVSGTQLRISGEVPIKPTDFGIPPPVIMDPPNGRLSIKVLFDWTVERTNVR